jgi:uncharacterized membrane protein YedE/YeeE
MTEAVVSTLITSLAGGVLIGLGAALLLLGSGRIAGISGITAGLLVPGAGDVAWRGWFLAGLVGTGAAIAVLDAGAFAASAAPLPVLVGAGLLVGVGTRLGGGCTSGHGVCGIGRLSPASLVATLVFMATGALAVTALRHVLGSAS